MHSKKYAVKNQRITLKSFCSDEPHLPKPKARVRVRARVCFRLLRRWKIFCYNTLFLIFFFKVFDVTHLWHTIRFRFSPLAIFAGANPNTMPKPKIKVTVTVSLWKNDNHREPEAQCKRWVLRERYSKRAKIKNLPFSKLP